jgi:hypothetical protein
VAEGNSSPHPQPLSQLWERGEEKVENISAIIQLKSRGIYAKFHNY